MKECPTCGHIGQGLRRWDDGSTVRHRNRERCQAAARDIIQAMEDDDGLAALQAWESLVYDVEREHVWRWLTIKQRDFIRAAQNVSNVQAGF